MKLITNIDNLPPALAASISAEERAYIEGIMARGGLPFAVTSHFASLAGPEPDDPIRRQFMPDPHEAQIDPFALEDPLGEACHRAAPRLIHQYRDRALLKTTAHCGGFCRFCFRRVWVAKEASFITAAELKPVLDYLNAHPEIREILLSGGDPLTASDERLEWLFQGLHEARPGLREARPSLRTAMTDLRAANPALSMRICTRLPIIAPDRITPELIGLLRRFQPLRLTVHINHPRELSPASRHALSAIVEASIPVLVQTVLLKGVNDNAATLAALFRECQDLGLIPYYLFQLDLAPGTAHFRVPLKRGLDLYRELQRILVPALVGTEPLLQGTLLPAYAVDLPGGGGKIRLSEESIAGEEDRREGRAYLLKDKNGKLWPYPADD